MSRIEITLGGEGPNTIGGGGQVLIDGKEVERLRAFTVTARVGTISAVTLEVFESPTITIKRFVSVDLFFAKIEKKLDPDSTPFNALALEAIKAALAEVAGVSL